MYEAMQNSVGLGVGGYVSLRGAANNLPWLLPFVTEYWDGLTASSIDIATGVSVWRPVKGTHNFTQGTANAQPSYSGGVLTFDGSNDFMVTGAFTLNQPCTLFFAINQVTWSQNDYFCDGRGNDTRVLRQGINGGGSSPEINIAASLPGAALNANLAVGADGIVVGVFNDTASVLQVNLTAANTGQNTGNPAASGITIGSRALGVGQWSNIAVKGFGYAASALDATQRAQLIRAMAARYGVSL